VYPRTFALVEESCYAALRCAIAMRQVTKVDGTMNEQAHVKKRFTVGIWTFAFGYFAAYVPYSAMTKALTSGLIADTRVDSFALLPPSVAASVVGMLILITSLRWWRFASHSTVMGISLPHPTRHTLVSGICTGLIVVTTTLAYTIEGVSIVFAMLLMRGGVLILSPLVDKITGRHVRWFSWMGLALSLGAVLMAFAEPPRPGESRFAVSMLLMVDIAIYLSAYFFRLRFMSKLAKSNDPNATKRYFVEEQMIATPSVLFFLGIMAIIGGNEAFMQLRYGFTGFWTSPVLIYGIIIGICSQFTGVFGALVLLDKSENAFAVSVNRSSSVMAGVGASVVLWLMYDMAMPSLYRMVGAGMIIVAILFLTVPPFLEKRRQQRA